MSQIREFPVLNAMVDIDSGHITGNGNTDAIESIYLRNDLVESTEVLQIAVICVSAFDGLRHLGSVAVMVLILPSAEIRIILQFLR